MTDREMSSAVADQAALTGICPWDQYGNHRWLPWLRLDNGSFVTRCLACGRVEQWDD
jgi:hypothetical protein